MPGSVNPMSWAWMRWTGMVTTMDGKSRLLLGAMIIAAILMVMVAPLAKSNEGRVDTHVHVSVQVARSSWRLFICLLVAAVLFGAIHCRGAGDAPAPAVGTTAKAGGSSASTRSSGRNSETAPSAVPLAEYVSRLPGLVCESSGPLLIGSTRHCSLASFEVYLIRYRDERECENANPRVLARSVDPPDNLRLDGHDPVGRWRRSDGMRGEYVKYYQDYAPQSDGNAPPVAWGKLWLLQGGGTDAIVVAGEWMNVHKESWDTVVSALKGSYSFYH